MHDTEEASNDGRVRVRMSVGNDTYGNTRIPTTVAGA